MSVKQKAKHNTDKIAKILTPTHSSLDAAPTSPDGLGAWQGGVVRGAISGLKAKPQRTASAKNAPGIDYASKIGPEQQKGYVKPTPA